MEIEKKEMVKMIEMGLIDEPEGIIRIEIDQEKIKELSESIKAIGQLQPILLRPVNDRYEIVYGHRRFLATQRLGKSRILATVKKLDDETTAVMRATENIAREDISAIEEAAVYLDLKERAGLNREEIGKRMGKSPGIIQRRIDLLRMPECLQKAIHTKKVSLSVAEELWPIADLTALEYYLSFAVDNGCTRDVARQWAKDWKDSVRRSESASEGGVQLPLSPLEPRPTYIPCDICVNPMDINESKVLRVCPSCLKIITDALEVRK